MGQVWRLFWVAFRRISVPFQAQVGVVLTVLVLVVALFEQAIDPATQRVRFSAMAGADAATFWLIALGGVMWLMGRLAGRLLYDRAALGVFWRQPISFGPWGAWVVALSLVAGAPFYGFGAWVSLSPVELLCCAMCLAPWWIAASHGSLLGLALGAPGLAVLWGVVASVHGRVWLAFVLLLPLAALSVAYSGVVYMRLRGVVRPARVWRARGFYGPLRALLMWDWLALWRTRRGFLVGCGVWALLIAGFSFAVGRHGGPSHVAVNAMVAGFSWVLSFMIRSLMVSLGPMFWPGRWPVGAWPRLMSLWGVTMAVSLLWTWVGLLFGRGFGGLEVLASTVLAVSVGMGQVFAALWMRRRSSADGYMAFGALLLFFLSVMPPWGILGMLGWCVLVAYAGRRQLLFERFGYG